MSDERQRFGSQESDRTQRPGCETRGAAQRVKKCPRGLRQASAAPVALSPGRRNDPPATVEPENLTAQEIIERAMRDRAVYDQMAARESEVWGRVLPEWERSEAKAEDTRASRELRIARNRPSLIKVARDRGLKFERGLTLGCGAGRLERELLQGGICQSFHGIDVSAEAVKTAQETAAREHLPLTYEVGDLNFIKLPADTYDLVVAQTSLHHVLFLEKVAEQVHRTLRPGGYLWIHDFIGETQGQYDEKRLTLINQVLAFLPEKFRTNAVTGRVLEEVKRPRPGNLMSPFECIRSAEIVPCFERWFETEWKAEFGAFMQIVLPPGTRAAYTENEDTRALFEALRLLDHLCVEEGMTKPTSGQYLMRPRDLAAVAAS